jgi:sec-independent protein translocase protein TatB
MLNLDPAKLIVIAVVAIILLGPDRLPQVAKQVGAAWRSFNEFRHRMESEVRSTMPDLPPTSEIARLARSPSALLHHLSTMSDQDDEQGDAAAATDGVGAADGTGAAGTGNGAHAPTGENGAVPDATAPPAPAPLASPAPLAPPIQPVQPVPRAQPPVPEPPVPVDPSLN